MLFHLVPASITSSTSSPCKQVAHEEARHEPIWLSRGKYLFLSPMTAVTQVKSQPKAFTGWSKLGKVWVQVNARR